MLIVKLTYTLVDVVTDAIGVGVGLTRTAALAKASSGCRRSRNRLAGISEQPQS